MANTSNGRANEDSGFDSNKGFEELHSSKELDILDFRSNPTLADFVESPLEIRVSQTVCLSLKPNESWSPGGIGAP